jgi:hypothetical protein
MTPLCQLPNSMGATLHVAISNQLIARPPAPILPSILDLLATHAPKSLFGVEGKAVCKRRIHALGLHLATEVQELC